MITEFENIDKHMFRNTDKQKDEINGYASGFSNEDRRRSPFALRQMSLQCLPNVLGAPN